MKRRTRKVIARVGNSLLDMGTPNTLNKRTETFRPMSAKELTSIAETLEAVANYWEANPGRWIQGTELATLAIKTKDGSLEPLDMDISEDDVTLWEGDTLVAFDLPRMCNIGMVIYGGTATQRKTNKITGFAPKSRKAISYLRANSNFVIDLNDATPLEGNIAGLRMSANAYRFAAAGVEWSKAVRKAFASNSHLLQVQEARFSAKRKALWAVDLEAY